MTDNHRDPKYAVRVITDFVNSFTHDDDAFISELSQSHRTLQQAVGALFIKWLYVVAAQDDNWFDLRNEHLRATAKRIVDALGPHGRYFPMV